MWNSPASLSLRMLRAVFSGMASIREDTSGNLGGEGGGAEGGGGGGGGGGYLIQTTHSNLKETIDQQSENISFSSQEGKQVMFSEGEEKRERDEGREGREGRERG